MATYQNGILGAFSGTVGNVVGSSWKGIPVIRKRPQKTGREPTAAQAAQRAKFALMSKFLSPLNDLLNQAYRGKRMGGANKALSDSMHAVSGNYPHFSIDYSRVQLSSRMLPLGEPPVMSAPDKGQIQVSWKKGDGLNIKLTSGFSFIAAYSEELNRWIDQQFVIGEETTQSVMDVMPFIGRQVHVYFGFISWDRKKVSESRYMGPLYILS